MPEENNTQQTENANPQPTAQPNSEARSENQNTGPHKNTLMAVLAYIGILVLVPLFTTKDDPFVKFHVKQGLVLLVIEIAMWFLGGFLYMLWPVVKLIHLAILILAIIGIVNAVQGKEKELPLVGKFAHHFKL